MIGGDYTYKEDFKKNGFNHLIWLIYKIIDYKTLISIYCFVSGLESKLSICSPKYEDIVLKKIYILIEKNIKIYSEDHPKILIHRKEN